MPHSTVCNMTVSTKKTRPTLVKLVCKLCVMLHACKGNAPVSVKDTYVFVQAIQRGYGYGRVYMCVCHHQPNIVSVYVMEVILKVLTVGAPRDACVFLHVRSRVGVGVCIGHLPSPVDSYLCVCLYAYVC